MKHEDAHELLNLLNIKIQDRMESSESRYAGDIAVYSSIAMLTKKAIDNEDRDNLMEVLIDQLNGMDKIHQDHIKLGIDTDDTHLALRASEELRDIIEDYQ